MAETIDKFAGATATCSGCGGTLVRGGSDTTARPGNFHWRHAVGSWFQCADGKGVAIPVAGSIVTEGAS